MNLPIVRRQKKVVLSYNTQNQNVYFTFEEGLRKVGLELITVPVQAHQA